MPGRLTLVGAVAALAVVAALMAVRGVPGIETGGSPTPQPAALYPPNDPWAAYLADDATCPGGERIDLPLDRQADTMACLVDYARGKRGLSSLATVALLNRTALAKASRIVRCRRFAHDACGTDPMADALASGYTGPWGENLYMGSGRLGAPRVALDGWLNSPEHRENLFRAEWRTHGIAVQKVARFGAQHDAELWVEQFGTR